MDNRMDSSMIAGHRRATLEAISSARSRNGLGHKVRRCPAEVDIRGTPTGIDPRTV